MSTKNNFKILFSGEISPETDLDTAKKRLASALKASEERIELLFNGDEHLLTKNLTKEQAESYKTQLIDRIGIIVAISEEAKNNNSIETPLADASGDNLQKKINSTPTKNSSNKGLTIVLSLALIASLGFIGFTQFIKHESEIDSEKIEQLNQQIQSLKENKNKANAELTKFKQEFSIPGDRQLIPSCKAEEVETLTARLLLEGFPQLIEQSNPNLNIETVKLENTENEAEILYDLQRNIRVCSLVAEFSIKAENEEKQNILFNILYQIFYDDKNELSLSTIKHTLIGTRAN